MRNYQAPFWLVAGLAIGLAVAWSVSICFPPVPVLAVATHGQDNFAICTAPMDTDIEAIFVLDYLTGDLKATVLNTQMRKFNTLFEYNVLQDFPNTTKNPQFRVVSGIANIRQHVGQGQLAGSVIYVAEVTSGQVVAYGMPWVAGRASNIISATAPLVRLDRWQFRTTAIRDQ